jgi:ABC-type transporter Mla maintaining outer membrane lipid asymmetry ATPase subunit MlaF
VLLELRGVYKSFGAKDILAGASMQIRRGEAVGIIGAPLCTPQASPH